MTQLPHAQTRLIFSDVDGTFLDERYARTFLPDFLRETLSRERVVFVSSRTLDELQDLQERLGARIDVIGENGAFIATRYPEIAEALEALGAIVTQSAEVRVAALASPRSVVRANVGDEIRRSGSHAVVADELPTRSFAKLSESDVESATKAQRRRHSVLLHMADARLVDRLRAAGLDASFGGRWMAVIAGSNKGRAVQTYGRAAEMVFGRLETVGIGNAPNDQSLLRTVDHAFVVMQQGGLHDAELTAVPGAHLLSHPGPEGWREMLELLEEQAAGA